jgi:hypothetical protein
VNSPLITNNTLKYDKQRLKDSISYCSNVIIKKLQPRYIVTAVEDFYYERMPYLNANKYLSRFINISYVIFYNL